MSKHTEGPWSRNIPPITKYPTIYAGRNTHICVVSTRNGLSLPELEANAKLIAAAPDLLEALVNMNALYEAMMEDVNHGASCYNAETLQAMNEVPILAKRVIAKATE